MDFWVVFVDLSPVIWIFFISSLEKPVPFTPSLTEVTISLDTAEELIVRENETSPLTVCADLTHPVDFQFSIFFVLNSSKGGSNNYVYTGTTLTKLGYVCSQRCKRRQRQRMVK